VEAKKSERASCLGSGSVLRPGECLWKRSEEPVSGMQERAGERLGDETWWNCSGKDPHRREGGGKRSGDEAARSERSATDALHCFTKDGTRRYHFCPRRHEKKTLVMNQLT
jgi:hypothetical protein